MALDGSDVSLLLVQRDGLGQCVVGLTVLSTQPKHLGEGEQDCGALVEGIRGVRQLDSLSCEALGFVELTPPRQNRCPNCPPGELGAHVVGRRVFLGDAAPVLGSRIVVELAKRFGQVGGVRGEQAELATLLAEPAQRLELTPGGLGVTRQQLDVAQDGPGIHGRSRLSEVVEDFPGLVGVGACRLELTDHGDEPGEKPENMCSARSARVGVCEQLLAPSDCVACGRRTVVQRHAELPQTCRGRPGCAAVVDHSSLGRFLPLLVAAEVPAFDEAEEEPRPSQATIVARKLEHGNGSRC